MKRVLMLVALLVGVYLVTPAEAQGRFWVLVNGALRYTGPVTITGALTVTSSATSAFTGPVTAQNFTSTAGGGYSWTGRESLGSSANGLMQIAQASFATVGLELNTGTAAPTATTCGTGTVTTHSNNVAGQITATGATTCTVTFGAPAWSFTPFCTATDVTTAAALRISAASATAITVTNLTSGDVFNWVCGGGAF